MPRITTDYARRGLGLGYARRSAGMGGVTTPGPTAFAVDPTETRDYVARLDASVLLLKRDHYKQIVYEDPTAAADKAEEWGGPVAGEEAALLVARAKLRGPSQTSKDVAWSHRFREFRLDWEQHVADVKTPSLGAGIVAAWDRTEAFEDRFRLLHGGYTSLGSTLPTQKLLPKFKGSGAAGIPWTGIVVVGGLISLAVFSQSLVKLIRG